MECSRCLTPAEAVANDDFTYIFVRPPEHIVSMELSASEMDEVFYDGDIIDLMNVAVEQVSLLAPFSALCRDDCKGLCPVCGKNKNEEECSCEKITGDEKFAVLKGFNAKR